MFNLSPKENKFFDMFIEFGDLIYRTSKMLGAFATDLTNPEEKFAEIKLMEQQGDRLLHSIMEELNKSFITPIDREDIHMIGKTLDDVLDFIETTASRFVMFNVTRVNDHVLDLCVLVEEICNEVRKLMVEFKNMKKSKKLSNTIVEINRLENEGDIRFRRAVRELFNGQTSAVDIIVWKEIHEKIEGILNACEDLAHIIEGVVMKHA